MTSGFEKNSSMSSKSKFELDSDHSPRFGCLAPLIKKNQDHTGASNNRTRKEAPSRLFSLQITFRIFLWMSSSLWLLQLQKKTLCFLFFFFFAVSLYSSSESPTGKFPQVTSSSLFYFISLVLFTCAQPCKHSPNTPADKLALQQTVTPAERPTEMDVSGTHYH